MADSIPVARIAPPIKKNIPRIVWIGGGIAASLFAIFICSGAGVGVSYVFNVGPMAQPAIVGKWEPAGPQFVLGLGGKITFEFKRNGTGVIETERESATFQTKNPDAPRFEKAVHVEKLAFKWRIEQEEKPVLVIEFIEAKHIGLDLMLGITKNSHFKREGDTLTLTPLQAPIIQAGVTMPPLVLRRMK